MKELVLGVLVILVLSLCFSCAKQAPTPSTKDALIASITDASAKIEDNNTAISDKLRPIQTEGMNKQKEIIKSLRDDFRKLHNIDSKKANQLINELYPEFKGAVKLPDGTVFPLLWTSAGVDYTEIIKGKDITIGTSVDGVPNKTK
jgi:hypothetical protein